MENPKIPRLLSRKSPKALAHILDTNVLLSDANALDKYERVIIPLAVLKELDRQKVGATEKARNARAAVRALSAHLEGTEETHVELSDTTEFDDLTPDQQITHCAIKHRAVLVTNDIAMRLQAKAVGVVALAHSSVVKVAEGGYTGHAEIEVEGSLIEEFRNTGKCSVEGEFNWNEFITITDLADVNNFETGRYDGVTGQISRIDMARQRNVWGMTPRNAEQVRAMDLLLDDTIKLVTIKGLAGSGKSIIAVAAGLQKIEEAKYVSVMIIKNPVSTGAEIGFIPGSAQEKLQPFTGSITDSIEALMEGSGKTNKKKKVGSSADTLFEQGIIQMEPLCFIRGRSIRNHWIILDEAQQLDYLTLKTVLTRAGENTKIILVGDPSQIDTKGLDSENNGLSIAVELFKNNPIYGHVTLETCERSDLAALAAEVMK